MWKSHFGRPTPSTRRRRRDRVNTSHWLISTQLKKLKTVGKKGRIAQKLIRQRMTPTQKRDYADKQSKAHGGGGTLSPSQHTRLVKLLKVNSRRDSS